MKNKKIIIAILSLVCLGIFIGITFGILIPQRQKAIAWEQTETRSAVATADEIALIDGMTSTANAWTKTPTPTNTFTPTLTSTPTITPTITPTLGIGSTRVRESDGQVQVYVPEGEFTMGDDSPWPVNGPKHQVYLDSFWIDQTEITNGQYMACVQAGTCNPPEQNNSYHRKDYFGNPEYDNFPVVYISWDKADTYCEWAGASLLTEAQWEKAARGTDGRTFPWGNALPDRDYVNAFNYYKDTIEVGTLTKGASPYGVFNMAGNVREWVMDYLHGYNEDVLSYKNPIGSTEANASFPDWKMIRGGDWSSDIGWITTYQRMSLRIVFPTTAYYGFRCANNE